MDSAELLILFDNHPGETGRGMNGLTPLWGFAALIRTARHHILFDTGSNGRVLLRNMAALGVSPTGLDWLFLSHPHWDHMGGLDSVLELNPGLTLVLHQGFSKHLIRDLEGQCGELIQVGPEPRTLAPGLHTTGMLEGDPAEQALVLESGDLTAVISGCAHPGMERVVDRARGFLGHRIHWAVGGFHLMYADAPRIDRSIAALQALGVERVVPTHCTGDAAQEAFRKAYGAGFFEGGVGRRIDLGPNQGIQDPENGV